MVARVPRRYELNGLPRTYRPSREEAAAADARATVAFSDEPSLQTREAADRLARDAAQAQRAEFLRKYLRGG